MNPGFLGGEVGVDMALGNLIYHRAGQSLSWVTGYRCQAAGPREGRSTTDEHPEGSWVLVQVSSCLKVPEEGVSEIMHCKELTRPWLQSLRQCLLDHPSLVKDSGLVHNSP